jgi:hypothetical protein
MPKHEPETHTLEEIIQAMDYTKSCAPWFEAMGINFAKYEAALDAEEFDKAAAIEADYIKAHSKDMYRVVWPEHVRVPKFNSDATYQPV